jgi:hypothetical protein
MKNDILIEKLNKFERERAQKVIEGVYDHPQSEILIKKHHINPEISKYSENRQKFLKNHFHKYI